MQTNAIQLNNSECPICVINPAWIAVIISILSPLVVHLLARRRDRILAEDGKRRDVESRKRDFIICMNQQRNRIAEILRFEPRQYDFQKFHTQSRPQIENAISALKPFLTDNEAGRSMDALWTEYNQIPEHELDAKYEGSVELDFEKRFPITEIPPKPSEEDCLITLINSLALPNNQMPF